MLMLVALKFTSPAEMTVTIDKARNLELTDKRGKLDRPYVSVSFRHIHKTLKKQRTQVVKQGRRYSIILCQGSTIHVTYLLQRYSTVLEIN